MATSAALTTHFLCWRGRAPAVYARWAALLLVFFAAVLGASGCAFLNGFLDPTAVGPNPLVSREGTLDIRSSLSLQDTPPGGLAASDPRPEDIVPVVEDYRFEIGDILNVRVFQLLGRNTETTVQATIDENGKISIPAVGDLYVRGLTRDEIEAELVDAIIRKGIVLDPEVIIEPLVRRNLSYTVYGTVSQPNVYPLTKYDLRILEAVNLAGGLLDAVTEIFVTRDPGRSPPVPVIPGETTQPAQSSPAETPLTMSAGLSDSSGALRQPVDAAPPQSEPTPERSTTASAEQEIFDTMVRGASNSTTEPAPIQPAPSQPRWIWYNDRWVETQPVEESRPTPAPDGPAAPPLREPDIRPTIDWEQIAEDHEQRVIKISAEALRNGDPRQNIVVRAGDTIRVAAGEFGEYYLTGQITRPGAYSLTGRNITLKAAVAAAGDFSPLAWPSNCTIFRRYGDREEMRHVNLDAIFAGREQDLFVKKDDLILVGTSPVAPFLAVLRNSFRASYGFGFVYDRNFADVDAYNAKFNPENLPRRFPNLFP